MSPCLESSGRLTKPTRIMRMCPWPFQISGVERLRAQVDIELLLDSTSLMFAYVQDLQNLHGYLSLSTSRRVYERYPSAPQCAMWGIPSSLEGKQAVSLSCCYI